ncbi:M15 family metallopeptidase [Oerskovia sp. NPDC060338]|uniref:M15 family metallopeptidase n=1 Tax=Oerskovia sp. NPDC060338 TaxID=3347100 RepID=UPI003659AF73
MSPKAREFTMPADAAVDLSTPQAAQAETVPAPTTRAEAKARQAQAQTADRRRPQVRRSASGRSPSHRARRSIPARRGAAFGVSLVMVTTLIGGGSVAALAGCEDSLNPTPLAATLVLGEDAAQGQADRDEQVWLDEQDRVVDAAQSVAVRGQVLRTEQEVRSDLAARVAAVESSVMQASAAADTPVPLAPASQAAIVDAVEVVTPVQVIPADPGPLHDQERLVQVAEQVVVASVAVDELPIEDATAVVASIELAETERLGAEVELQRLAEEEAARVEAARVEAERLQAQREAEAKARKGASATTSATTALPTISGANGRLSPSQLCPISWAPSSQMACAASQSLDSLNAAFVGAFGRNLTISGGYRSFSEQVSTKASRGKWAATPGTSNHGWGLAVDLGGGINSFSSPEYRWMKANAARFGFVHPAWAEPGGSLPEPWHWEFVG